MEKKNHFHLIIHLKMSCLTSELSPSFLPSEEQNSPRTEPWGGSCLLGIAEHFNETVSVLGEPSTHGVSLNWSWLAWLYGTGSRV